MMNPIISKNPLVVQIAAGAANDELLEFLLDKKLAFTDEEYLESLVFVLPKPAFHDRALARLSGVLQSVKENYVQKKDAQFQVAGFILDEAFQAGHFNTLALIIQNQYFPTDFLLRIAAQGKESTLEVLLDNQVRLIAYPEIMEKMEMNPACGPFIRGKINELREFYFQNLAVEAIPEKDVLNELDTIIAQEQSEDGSLSPVTIKQQMMTSLQRINHMSIAQRIHLALTGNKTERLILIKDANRMVQMAVIESPKMADDEVLIHTRNLSLSGEIVAKIANNRDWTKNYSIVMALVQNPKTPVSRAIGFMK
ncbi:MAG: hypothetical protein NTZ12_12270, partial [Candidatus Aminicenantes bacterium]|nr:hypothetical protein [Candidatus Aminicenantes bacterium]